MTQPLNPFTRYSVAVMAFCVALVGGGYHVREAVRPQVSQESQAPPVLPTVRDHQIWMPPTYRSALSARRVDALPPSSVVLMRGLSCYFADVGQGWYALRLTDQFEPGEAVVTDGAFVLKSEYLR